MIDKLEEIKRRFEEVGENLVKPDIMSDMKKYTALNKEYKDLGKIVDAYKDYKNILDNITSAKEVLKTEKDEEFRDMAKMEINELEPLIEPIEDKIKQLLIPKDPADEKNVILEIRAGAGGDELFGGYPWRYYQTAKSQNFEDYIDQYYLYWQRLTDNTELKKIFSPIWSEVKHVWTRDIFRDVFINHKKM